MSLQTATDKVTTGVRNLTDDVLQSAQEAVQTTRAAADQSLDKAEASVRALRRQLDQRLRLTQLVRQRFIHADVNPRIEQLAYHLIVGCR